MGSILKEKDIGVTCSGDSRGGGGGVRGGEGTQNMIRMVWKRGQKSKLY